MLVWTTVFFVISFVSSGAGIRGGVGAVVVLLLRFLPFFVD